MRAGLKSERSPPPSRKDTTLMASRLVRALIVGGGAAAAALNHGMGSASAAGTWTVTVGSATGTVAFNGATVGAHTPANPDIIFNDTTSGLGLSCDSGTAGGSITVGTGLSGADLAGISGSSTTWTDCVGPLGIELDPTGSGTWNLQGDSYDSASGITTGRITDVNAHVSSPDGTSCVFDVTGSVNGTFTNSSQQLAINPDPTLNISNVTGCFGLINAGDQASFQAIYTVSSPAGTVSITSP